LEQQQFHSDDTKGRFDNPLETPSSRPSPLLLVHFSTQNHHTPLSLASHEESSSSQIPQLPTETETQIQQTKNPNSNNPELTHHHKSYITTTTTKIVFKNCNFAIQFLHHNKNRKKKTQQQCEEK
jgi:hypothetical protein